MAKWVFATKNSHKLEEALQICEGKLILEGLAADLPEAPEPYNTLYENALAKASFYYGKLQEPVIAEDSGLFVVALRGSPGAKAARYGGPVRLLETLQGQHERRAYFAAVIVAYWGPNAYRFYTGYCAGHIAYELRGEAGFGYDPVFIPLGETRTLAELGPTWKNSYSHRAQAFQKFLQSVTRFTKAP
ncbi:MAG: RdgB/HAM1 family non-canonical purine NTP pyrophosphatase [Bacteroidia bacterium]|nr:RdgB/HAM1 family non-canonical purine NTP pyrophosphatase [Bacteroidia bacterium]GIV24277.1 MAG: non-canonical purine NTP pyrophosphatase [Bacteroidia bacterium]